MPWLGWSVWVRLCVLVLLLALLLFVGVGLAPDLRDGRAQNPCTRRSLDTLADLVVVGGAERRPVRDVRRSSVKHRAEDLSM